MPAAGARRISTAARRRLRNSMPALIRARYPRIPRRVSGYNLDELLPENHFNLARAVTGSEGTLALVLNATVQLVPKPKELVLVVLGFDDIFLAGDHVPMVLEHKPEAVEAFDHYLVEFWQEKGWTSVKLLPPGRSYLIVELGGATVDEARARGEELVSRAKQAKGVAGVALFSDPRERNAVWGLRESGLGSGAPREGVPRGWPGAEDFAVHPNRLGEYLRRFDQLLQAPQPDGQHAPGTLRRRLRAWPRGLRLQHPGGHRNLSSRHARH